MQDKQAEFLMKGKLEDENEVKLSLFTLYTFHFGLTEFLQLLKGQMPFDKIP